MISRQQSTLGVPEALLRKARSALEGRRKLQAITAYLEILKLSPGSAPLLVEAARAYTLNGDRDQARALLIDALASGNVTMEIAIRIASSFFLAGDHQVAHAILSDGWQKTRFVAFLVPLMEVLERLGKLEEALGLLVEFKSPSPRAWLLEGLIAARQKDFARALTAFSKAQTGSLAAGDGLTALRAGLEEAKCHERLGDYAKAWSAMTAIRAKLFPPRSVIRDSDRQYTTKTQACLRDLDYFVKQGRVATPVSGESAPLLVTGHPRSGTSVVTVALCKALNRTQYDEPDAFLNALERHRADQIALNQLDESTRQEVRADYFDLLRQIDPETDSQSPLIDKNPVLELRVPRWLTIFPVSTVLFVQRHPLDIMLSCLFTYLPPNPISLQYYNSERNAATIETSRHFQNQLLEHFPENCTAIGYEDFIRDGSFAGAKLPDRYQGAEAKETTLHSPNYSQAKESAHARSVRRYENYLPYFPPQITKRFLKKD
jgi:tetratricopeptide (TPR) repeat protein